MQLDFFKTKTGLIFLLVVVYVFAAYIWWTLLLNGKTSEEYRLKIELAHNNYVQENNLPPEDLSFFKTALYHQLKKEETRQHWMIYGEASVFILLLLVGSWQIKSSFQKELELARQKNNFLLSITHELKSPLASIKLSLETLVKRLSLEEKFKRILNNSLQDVDRLNKLVGNILLAARMENNSYPFQWEELNLSELAEDAMAMVEERFEGKRNFLTEIESGVYCKTDRMALNAVLVNLLENAVKYSEEQTDIKLKLYENSRKNVNIEIIDQGFGIPVEEKKNIFQKFYRIGNEETRNTSGTGLGLYIVHSIMQQMNGNIEIMDNKGGGSIFRLTLHQSNDKQNV